MDLFGWLKRRKPVEPEAGPLVLDVPASKRVVLVEPDGTELDTFAPPPRRRRRSSYVETVYQPATTVIAPIVPIDDDSPALSSYTSDPDPSPTTYVSPIEPGGGSFGGGGSTASWSDSSSSSTSDSSSSYDSGSSSGGDGGGGGGGGGDS